MSNVYGKRSGETIVIDNGLGRPKLEMHNFNGRADISLSIMGPRGGTKATVRISKDDLREALLMASIAQRRATGAATEARDGD